MKTPRQLLRERKTEIYAEYERVFKTEYGKSNTSPKSKYWKKFEAEKQADLIKIKKLLDQYNEALNVLVQIERGVI